MSNGFVIYNGPSLIDGAPIVVIAIKASKNAKTGGMVQSYIIRSDIHPMDASKSGADYSICGSCKHRGDATDNPAKKVAENRSCYVSLFQGASQVYKAFKRGVYADISNSLELIADVGLGRMVRMGSYGDPAAAPGSVFMALIRDAIGSTGYTHHTDKLADVAPAGNPLMVSADSAVEAKQAHAKGYRTFRVIPVSQWQVGGWAVLMKNEVLCPASNEGQPKSGKVTCDSCKLCNGNISSKAKSIAIVAHGNGKKYVSA